MSTFLSSVLAVVLIMAGILTAGCFVFRLAFGRFPAWFYGLVFAWWWPVRPSSALMIAASLIDDDEECTDWIGGDWLSDGFKYRKANISATKNMEGMISGLKVDGVSAHEDSWGFYNLVRAHNAWLRRKRAIDIVTADRKAAEAVLRSYAK